MTAEVKTVFMSFEPARRVVWKYAANPKGVFRVPWDSDVVLFDYDPKTDSPWPHIWAETTPEHGPRTRTLVIHGTGHPVDGTWQASCVDRQTGLVWHLYDITTGPQAS